MSEAIPILEYIAQAQFQSNPKYYLLGILPSIRQHPYLAIRRQDNNIFFTALTLRILQEFSPQFPTKAQKISEDICRAAQVNYAAFRSKEGLDTYNFWQTLPSRHFPNGYLMRHFRHFQLPDDIDDTALVYTTQWQPPEKVQWLRERLIFHTERYQPQVKSPQLKGVYPTWFGKHMPLDFDLCAICNWFEFLSHYGLALIPEDLPSQAYLRSCLQEANFMEQPFRYAPHYANRAIILYHYARLNHKSPEMFSPAQIQQLRQLINLAAKQSHSINDKLILAIACLRLGENPYFLPEFQFNTQLNIRWFVAGMANYYLPLSWAAYSAFHFHYHCPAYSAALQLEYFALLRALNPA